jgi:nickel/cobalt transporter (NicO) family protein
MTRRTALRRSGAAAWLLMTLLLVAVPFPASADTVASLLGNFTINQFCGIQLTDTAVTVHYAVVYGQLPALAELHRADTNNDGVTTQAERDAYVESLAPELARALKVFVDGVPIALQLTDHRSSLPVEQGGFSLRLDADFAGALPAGLAAGPHALTFSNGNFNGQFGWHEVSVRTVPSIAVFNTNAFDTSLTNGLTAALPSLPPGGPLDERQVKLSFIRGAAPVGATLLGPRAGQAPPAAQPATIAGESAWLQRQTRALVDAISAPHIGYRVTLFALLAAFVLGALHAFSPGHGKTIVGAYLIGSRGTPKHAVFLGATVTATHTLGVFALGFATLFASRFIVPERLFPILSLLSGLIVLGMGMILLAQRWRVAAGVFRQSLASPAFTVFGGSRMHSLVWAPAHPGHGADHDHHHDHDHDHGDSHDHAHSHDGRVMHSHGGTLHSHAPPTDVSWRSLLALGISGGLIPCPSAMVLLLAAVALNKTAYGMLLVLGFSIGLAVTLTGVGLGFLYARSRLPKSGKTASRWVLLLPLASAAAITVVGVVLCVGALHSGPSG